MSRIDGRASDELRPVKFTRNFVMHPQGSVLAEMGNTKVLCCVTITEGVPHFLTGQDKGWLDAEYGMLPGSTNTRNARERQRVTGRAIEIERLIGRSLRACLDLRKVGQNTIMVDCDVIQADGGTRTCSITGAYVALYDAVRKFRDMGIIKEDPFISALAAISVGIYQGEVLLDLKYEEDCVAEVDSNFIVTDKNEIIEVQGTGEHGTFNKEAFDKMYDTAMKGIRILLARQHEALEI